MAKKQTEKKEKKNPHLEEVAIGIGLTTAAVAAAGAYFLYGSDKAAKNRKTVKSWALKAKAEVLEKLEDAKEMSQEEYQELVQGVAGAYKTAKGASTKELKEFAAEMGDHWKKIEKAAKPLQKKAKKAVKVAKKETKAASKTVKKTATKVKKAATKPVKKVASKK